MEGVLTHRRPRGLVPLALAPVPVAVLMPGASPGEWELCRSLTVSGPSLVPDASGASRGVTRQVFATLDAAAANLQPAEPFVLALPIEMGLVQRLSLPAAEPSELEEMARIQLEKILPYPADSVGVVTQEIFRGETDVVLAVETVYYDRLLAMCQPLIARGGWPLRVVFQAVAMARGLSGGENAAFLYRESGKYVLGVCENGRLSFAQALGAQTPEDLAAELPAVLLGAELDGVPTAFSVLRLDQRETDGRGVLAAALNVPVEPFDTGAAALNSVPTASATAIFPRRNGVPNACAASGASASCGACCSERRVTPGCCCWRFCGWASRSSRSAGSTPGCANCVPWRKAPRPVPRIGKRSRPPSTGRVTSRNPSSRSANACLPATPCV